MTGRGCRRFMIDSVQWLVAVGFCVLFHAGIGVAHPEPDVDAPKKKLAFHTVRRGENLSRIASRYGVSVKALIEANRLNRPDTLNVGQRLLLPEGPAVIPGDRVAGRVGASRSDRMPAGLVLSHPELNGDTLSLLWPLEGPVSSSYGRRRRSWHKGIDIKAEVGTPIQAAAAGIVIFSGWERLYGRVVKVEHDHAFVTVYAHNLQNLVETGDQIVQGQVIGTVGRTGRATTAHLHFEVRNNGRFFNPLFLLPEREIQNQTDDAEPE